MQSDKEEKAAALLLPLAGGAASLAVSWQRWINPFVDSGREMDVPWRLSRGGIVELRTAAGALRLPAREATATRQALDYLDRHVREGDTLTAFPESGFFNFVLGLRSPCIRI